MGILFSMSTLDLTPIFKSPRLPDIVAALSDRLRVESELRQRFYDEMSDDQKVEFIDGEVVMHSRLLCNRHLLVKLLICPHCWAYFVRQLSS